jgi:hypothetical protein
MHSRDRTVDIVKARQLILYKGIVEVCYNGNVSLIKIN